MKQNGDGRVPYQFYVDRELYTRVKEKLEGVPLSQFMIMTLEQLDQRDFEKSYHQLLEHKRKNRSKT